MKRLLVPVFAAGAILFAVAGAASAHAHPNAPYARHRGMHQEMRIRQGIRHGDLTAAERARLRAAQIRIRHLRHRMMSDGHWTLRERARLHRLMDRQSFRIHRLRHNVRCI